jgi:hypothetical protein
MIMMILGELCNFGAYAFVEAIVVVRTLCCLSYILLILLWRSDSTRSAVGRHLRDIIFDISQ